MPRTSAAAGALVIASMAFATFPNTGHAGSIRQTAVVTFEHPTWVSTARLIGTYIIEHDDARMARGEPCTALYRVGGGRRSGEEVVSFHCIPRERTASRRFSTRVLRDPISGTDTLTEYQFAGDTEAHGVPVVAVVEDRSGTPCPRDAAPRVAERDLRE